MTMTCSRRFKHVLQLAACVSVVAASTAPSGAVGDVARGKQIAKRWCVSCHLVSPDQKGANTDVPTFFEIARRSADSVTDLKAFLVDPHPPMPDLNLTRSEIDDLSDYIRSLK
jgi:mono/diheme cytochrome c family protein